LDTHFVLSESSCLVRTNFVSISHRLRGVQFTHKVILFGHLSNRVGKRDGDRERKSFWHGYHNDSDCDDKSTGYIANKLHVERAIVGSESFDNGRDHDCDEGQNGDYDTELTDSVRDRVELFLERGLLAFNIHRKTSPTLVSVVSDSKNNGSCCSFLN